MAELKVREFADALIEAADIDLTSQARGAIRHATSIEEAQRLAVLYGMGNDVVADTAAELGEEYTAGDVNVIRNVREGEDFSGPGPSSVDPNGADSAASNTGMSPAEIEAAAALGGIPLTGDPELDALITSLNAEEGEEDEPDYLLPDMEGVTKASVEAKIAAPGYQFYYGDPADGQYGTPLVNPVIYTAGQELEKWTTYSPETRAIYTRAMVDAGIIDAEQVGGYEGRKLTPQEKRLNWEAEQKGEAPKYTGGGYEGTAGGVDPSGVSEVQINGYRQALGAAGYLGTGPMGAIRAVGATNKYTGTTRGGGGGGGGGRAPFSVPASLRTIPDYATLQQNVTDMMRQAMGRKPEDWEVTMLADEMQTQYKAKNAASIDAARAAYEQGNRGVGTEIEVPDPGQRTQKYLEETWANEIDRRQDVGERANTNNLLMQSLTQGAKMVGG